MKERRTRKGRTRIEYTDLEEKFYRKHKRQIIDGLSGLVPKNQIKRVFMGSVQEQIDVNHLSKRSALEKTLRTTTFSSSEDNFKYYKGEIFENYFKKGFKYKDEYGNERIMNLQTMKKYLGMYRYEQFDPNKLDRTSDGWVYKMANKSIILDRNPDTKTEGYIVRFA